MHCTNCGNLVSSEAKFCTHCGTRLVQQPVAPVSTPVSAPAKAPARPAKQGNMLTGFVGALIGAALGAGSIILLNQIGYVASVSGLILAVCTIKGYELLGGKLNTPGILLCILVIMVTPYIADRINWAILIMQSFPEEDISFGLAFSVVHDLIADVGLDDDYISNLLMLYGFAALGAFGTLRNLFRR